MTNKIKNTPNLWESSITHLYKKRFKLLNSNKSKDALAVSGASRHPDIACRQQRLQEVQMIMNVQRMMVDIDVHRHRQGTECHLAT